MTRSLVRSKKRTRYLYTLREIIKVVKFLLSKYIYSLLNIAIISNRVRYLYL